MDEVGAVKEVGGEVLEVVVFEGGRSTNPCPRAKVVERERRCCF